MSILQKQTARTLYIALGCSVISLSAIAQDSQRPNLEGIWTNASLTGLNRPQGVESLTVPEDEARRIAAATPIAGLEGGLDEGDGVNDTPQEGADDFGVRAYNNFWVDPGSNLALVKGEYRTSYIIDPPTGRLPRLEIRNTILIAPVLVRATQPVWPTSAGPKPSQTLNAVCWALAIRLAPA